MSFASNKIQILELVDAPGHRKPSNFGHMISCSQEAYPISLKQIAKNDSYLFCNKVLAPP